MCGIVWTKEKDCILLSKLILTVSKSYQLQLRDSAAAHWGSEMLWPEPCKVNFFQDIAAQPNLESGGIQLLLGYFFNQNSIVTLFMDYTFSNRFYYP